MNLSTRSYEKELLDGEHIPMEDISRNMQELDFINKYLGGHRVTLAGFKALKGELEQITICEIGCGGGDNLLAIESWCLRHHIGVKLIGIDINADCIAIAKDKFMAENSRFLVSDYALIHFDQEKPDIIFSSLFCHHFTEAGLQAMLTWMKTNSRIGFFINDLHRHSLAYYSILWLTRLFSKSYLVKNDAPLSVRRGFIRNDWTGLMHQSSILNYDLRWKWAFRWLLTVKLSH